MRAEQAVEHLLDHAFEVQAVGLNGVLRFDVANAQPALVAGRRSIHSKDTDVIVRSARGLQLEYCDRTAAWLAEVASAPGNFSLIYSFLAGEILSNAAHPMGRKVNEFDKLIRKHFNAAGHASTERAQAQAQCAARCMKIGCDRLLKLILDFLPPLHADPGLHFARQALEAVVFDKCGETLRALLSRAYGVEDAACNDQLDRLQHLLPMNLETLGVPERLWLSNTDVDDLPYAEAIEVMQSLQSFPSPMQKLQLFSDACAEIAECALRHHRRQPQHTAALGLKRPSLRSAKRTSLRRSISRERGMHHVPSWQCALDIGAAEAAAGAALEAANRANRGMASWQGMIDQMMTEVEQKELTPAERDAEASLGADELIPLVAYVLARAKLPDLISELSFVRSFFLNEDALLGQHGYALATFEAAMTLLTSDALDPSTAFGSSQPQLKQRAKRRPSLAEAFSTAPVSIRPPWFPLATGTGIMQLPMQLPLMHMDTLSTENLLSEKLRVVHESPGSSISTSSTVLEKENEPLGQALMDAYLVDGSPGADQERAQLQARLIEEAQQTVMQIQVASEELERTRRRVEEMKARSNMPQVRLPQATTPHGRLYLKQLLSQLACTW